MTKPSCRSSMIHYNILNRDIWDKRDKLSFFFKKSVIFFLYALLRGFPSQFACHLAPAHILEDSVLDDPLHPLWNVVHPLLHLHFQPMRLLPALFQNLLLMPQASILLIGERCSRNLEVLRVVRKIWIAPGNIRLHDGLPFLFQPSNVLFRLFDQLARVYVLLQNLFLHWNHLPMYVLFLLFCLSF